MATDPARTVAEAYRCQRRLGTAQIARRTATSLPTRRTRTFEIRTMPTTSRRRPNLRSIPSWPRWTSIWATHHGAWSTQIASPPTGFLPVSRSTTSRSDLSRSKSFFRKTSLTSAGSRFTCRSRDWDALFRLVLADHAEGRRTGALDLSPEFSAAVVAGYRAKSDAYHFYLAMREGIPVAYGAHAAAPNGAGMIEDLFTLQSARRRGIATAMIAAFATRLRDAGCHTIFVDALATEQPKHIYFRLGFRPVMLTRTWVRKSPKKE